MERPPPPHPQHSALGIQGFQRRAPHRHGKIGLTGGRTIAHPDALRRHRPNGHSAVHRKRRQIAEQLPRRAAFPMLRAHLIHCLQCFCEKIAFIGAKLPQHLQHVPLPGADGKHPLFLHICAHLEFSAQNSRIGKIAHRHAERPRHTLHRLQGGTPGRPIQQLIQRSRRYAGTLGQHFCRQAVSFFQVSHAFGQVHLLHLPVPL